MDALDIRHIASGIQADIYTFTLPLTPLPGSAGNEEDELIRLLESVDLRREAPPVEPTATPAPFDLPIDDVVDADELAGGRQKEGSGKSGGRVLAVKVVSAGKDGIMPRLRPHNVKVEAELLRQLYHPHVVQLLAYRYDALRSEHLLVMPYLRQTLGQWLVDAPILQQLNRDIAQSDRGCSPGGATESESARLCNNYCHRFIRQILDALVYLHKRGVAHRDLKPNNIMLDEKEDLVLIDFATAWTSSTAAPGAVPSTITGGESRDQGDEALSRAMAEVEVGTGPYRAPELLFGPTSYNPTSVDIWAAACVICELFRPPTPMLQIHVDSATSHQQQTGAWRGIEADQASDSGSDMDSGDDDAGSSGSAGGPLFSAAFGDIGLAGSIFGLLGTPNFETWPVRFFTMSVIILENPSFQYLPDAHKIPFHPRSASLIADRLPSLAILPKGDRQHFERLIEGMLKLEPGYRCSAGQALKMLDQDDNVFS